jgi:hypothetical protein
MKKVIDGKLYNTETAEEIANWSNGLSYSDFNNCEESLFLTKKGAWFLQGEGGAMSKYSRPCGDMTGGGSGFEVLTPDEAMKWLENHNGEEAIIKHFSDVLEEA